MISIDRKRMCVIMGIYLINISPLSIGRRYLVERRKDHKGRVLKPGESQRKNLTYVYRYTEGESSERNSVYAKILGMNFVKRKMRSRKI